MPDAVANFFLVLFKISKQSFSTGLLTKIVSSVVDIEYLASIMALFPASNYTMHIAKEIA